MCIENSKITLNSYDPYLKPIKFVRDLSLGYVYLTKFDLEIIDTLSFQRLKNIRQLTCQSVYPCSNHTRFEHSLGVMELIRRAINSINENKFIGENEKNSQTIINQNLQINLSIAALLHDVGHCPFSHLGELEFDKTKINEKLLDCIENEGLQSLYNELKTDFEGPNKIGAKHEKMSCIIILTIYKKVIDDFINSNHSNNVKIDYDLIIRSIIGFQYNNNVIDNKIKNVLISLVNSNIFDMDKLDYVMRDSYYTGIGTPDIDIERLFRNMFLSDAGDNYGIVFTNRAVPVLQNMIESRDELYMYVYNHHTAVFSDFMYSYILRRLDHNYRDFSLLLDNNNNKNIQETLPGMFEKDELFSVDAIFENHRSDSSLITLLNETQNKFEKIVGNIDVDDPKNLEIIKDKLIGSLNNNWDPPIIHEIREKLTDNIIRVYKLIRNYLRRSYFKSWWKSNYEFVNFMQTNFIDDGIRDSLCKWVCEDEDNEFSDEFRSQLAKSVTYITQRLWDDKQLRVKTELKSRLEGDEFFVVKRSSHFFDINTISKLDIALKKNEILEEPYNEKYKLEDYYIKSLTNVIPQKDYYTIYAKESFYIFTKQLSSDIHSEDRKRHYKYLQQIFVYVASTMIRDGRNKFTECFIKKNDEENAHEKIYKGFIEKYGL